MRLRLLSASLLAFALGVLVTPGAEAQEIVFLAFGDSITQGYGDTSNPGGGYAPRLERWLRQRGYDAVVEVYGAGGETTSSGLSRIDEVLAEGGDFLLLMEGTNDISQRASIESIRFNLDEMASRAEALGMSAVHATVIPRIPTAPVDPDNSATAALARAIRDLGHDTQRAVADTFALFENLPDVFENYYFYDPLVLDPVGHPNTDGYIEIAGLFIETILPLLETPEIQIVPPPSPLEAGFLISFGVDGTAVEQFVRLEWDFGDGGFAQTPPPGDLSAFYVFLHPGTYTVRLRGFTAGGAVSEDSVLVVVTGGEPSWETATVVIPLIAESADGQIASDLELLNSGIFFGIAEATFISEIRYDDPAPARRFTVGPQGTTRIADLLPTAFGLGAGRGALKITFYVFPEGSPGSFSARAVVRATDDPDGSDGALVAGIPAAAWSSSAKQVLNIPHGPTAVSTLAVANLDGFAGTVRFDLFDAAGAFVGSGVVELAADAARLRSISDLFRNLGSRPAPFRATFDAAAIRFSVAALVTARSSSEVRVLLSTP